MTPDERKVVDQIERLAKELYNSTFPVDRRDALIMAALITHTTQLNHLLAD